MTKTPKELAEEWIETNGWNTEPFRDEYTIEFQKQGYVAGYKAAAPQYRITHKIRQMVNEVTQSHIDEPSRSYVDIANLEAILKYVAEGEDG